MRSALCIASALLLFGCCGRAEESVTVELPATSTATASQNALLSGGLGRPPPCQTSCTAGSRCDTRCTDGEEKSCGAFGVCVACASACTSNAPCDQLCVENGQLQQCHTARHSCAQCSSAVCKSSGCGGHCMNPPNPKCASAGCVRTYSRCDAFGATIDDRDSDGLPDALEAALARKFFPELNMTASSRFQFYGLTLDPLGYSTLCQGNPNCKLPYVVRPISPLQGPRSGWCAQGQCVEISFVLPYNWDLGDALGAHSHRGDAEFVSMIVAYKRADDEPNGQDWGQNGTWEQAKTDAHLWRAVGRFYAAHLCSGNADSSRFVFPWTSVVQQMVFWNTMPVYVAEMKNGSYPSLGSCNGGADWADDCTGGSWLNRAALLDKLVNVGEEYGGSMQHPGYVCAGFDRTIAKPMHAFAPSTTTLDVWGTERFDTSASLYNLLRRYELDWGNGTRSCW